MDDTLTNNSNAPTIGPDHMPENQGAHQSNGFLGAGEDAEILRSLFPTHGVERVLLVNPPDADNTIFHFDTAKRGRYTNYPPYGLLILAQKLDEIGVEASVLNLNHEVLRRCHEATDDTFDFDHVWGTCLDDAIRTLRPDMVGVSCMFSMTHESFKQVCEHISAHNIPLVAGGVHVTNDVMRVLDDVPAIDIVITNEAELAFVTLINVINNNQDFADIKQAVFNERQGSDGTLERRTFPGIMTPPVECISEIPAFDKIDLSAHSLYGTIGAFYYFKPHGTRFATVLSARGCRAQCTFCSVRSFNGLGVRRRPVASVIEELEILRDEYGVKHIMWLDDDLLKNHDETISLFNEMVRRDLGLTWDATNGVLAASCTEEVIAAAEESGCIALNIGMESGNPEILKSVKKPADVGTLLRAAEVLRGHEKIHASVFLMLGFPNETKAMIFDTINVALEMGLDWYRIATLQPLPNTPIYDSMVAQGLIEPAGSHDLRFNLGAYGKQARIEQGDEMTSRNFNDAFTSIPMEAVPTKEQLTDIWFYMNYHLNFAKIFTEDRPFKIIRLRQQLRALSEVISPENGFALYFQAYLQEKFEGTIDVDSIQRLERRLNTSPYWQDRFSAFNLSIEDLNA